MVGAPVACDSIQVSGLYDCTFYMKAYELRTDPGLMNRPPDAPC